MTRLSKRFILSENYVKYERLQKKVNLRLL